MMHPDRHDLWRGVLLTAVEDAMNGPRGSGGDANARIREIVEARNYLIKPNRDFDTVCYLAGVDPDAMRDRLKRKLATARTPEKLVAKKATKRRARTLTYQGETHTISEWSDRIGISRNLISSRLSKGLSVADALSPHRASGRPKRRDGLVVNFATNLETGVCANAQEI